MQTYARHPSTDSALGPTRLPPSWPGSRGALRIAVTTAVIGLIATLIIGLLIRGSDAGLGAGLWLNGLHSPVLDDLSQAVAVAFRPTSAVVIGVLLAIVVALRTRHLMWGLRAGAAVACGWLVAGVLKVIVARPRPVWTDAVHTVVPPETDPSYPSGHVAFAAALATVVLLLTWRTTARWWVMAAGVLLVVITALTRVYAVVHYPSDVIAGAVCGMCGAVLAVAAMDAIGRRLSRALDAPQEHRSL